MFINEGSANRRKQERPLPLVTLTRTTSLFHHRHLRNEYLNQECPIPLTTLIHQLRHVFNTHSEKFLLSRQS